MISPLPDAIRRYTGVYADASGSAPTAIPGMTTVCSPRVGEVQYDIHRPLICLVAQGAKQVTMRGQTLVFGAGDSMVLTADVPTVTRIVKGSRKAPYLSFALCLDPALIVDLSIEMKAPADAGGSLEVASTEAEVADTALRMMRLLDRPASVPLLQSQLTRELHYWLLAGRHGPAIRRLGHPDSHAHRIARAVKVLRAEFKSSLPIERLASTAGMSSSSFHQHFRAVTSLSPLQFQKQLRLIEARRLMLADGILPGNAAYSVGYRSVPQFTREYRRLFGLPPAREVGQVKRGISSSAPRHTHLLR